LENILKLFSVPETGFLGGSKPYFENRDRGMFFSNFFDVYEMQGLSSRNQLQKEFWT